MGNNPSTPSSKHSAGHGQQHHGIPSSRERDSERSHNDNPTRREPKRRESIHAPSAALPKASAAPPSASLASAVAQPISTSTSTSPSQPRSISKSSANSRNRTGTIPGPNLIPQDAQNKTMGNDNSKPREASRSASARAGGTPPAIKTTQSPATRAVDVPGVQESNAPFEPSPLDPHAPPHEAYNLPPASFSRPPRLPLAIEEEVHTPGSPILSPTGDLDDIDQFEGRRGSVISSTIDDEEEPDEFQGYMPDTNANVSKIPTIIEWRDAGPNDRVYVTGTFTDWQRKYRLHWNGPSKTPNAVSAVLQLPPGTHHIKFLLNNDMVCSTHLPTTVDFTNILVNYVEVSSDTMAPAGKPSAPVAVPASTSASARPMDIRTKQQAPVRPTSPPPKSQLPSSPSPTPARASPRPTPVSTQAVQQESKPAASPSSAKPKQLVPRKQYTSQIPAYLLDLDTWPPPTESPEQSPDPTSTASRYQRANAATQHLPPPPSLPLFLSKSILNGATPMKDDSSVLIMPNHTVLNHLATTNIKQGVLATSATTRYKKKFLTTIMYKPRSEDGD